MQLSSLGITPQKEKQFAKKEILSAEDLVAYLPRSYKDFTRETGILPDTELSCLTVQVKRFQTTHGRIKTLKAYCIVPGGGEELVITWFNQNFLLDKYQGVQGHLAYVAGKIRYDAQYRRYEMSSPDMFEPNLSLGKRIFPIYPKITGMSEDYLTDKIGMALNYAELTRETLPFQVVSDLGLQSRKEALYKLHFPKSAEQLRQGQERLLFDDLLHFALCQEWMSRCSAVGSPFSLKTRQLMNAVLTKLPYQLTEDQESVVQSMLGQISQGKRVNALVQGDVGCGKTIVAFLMMAAFAGSGFQTVLMAPTQVLAKQHCADLSGLVSPLGYEVAYLGSETKAAERKSILKQIAAGEVQFIVGTHSVLGKDVEYKNLALTVTDEEHKFGVAQRNALVEKASAGVHSITMSATPIPRSLAQVIYGNTVQLHTIHTMPNGRLPVKTGIAVSRERIYQFLLSQIQRGHQAYVVCPMIDQNEDMGAVKSVQEISEEYQKALAPHGVKIATLTGRDTKTVTENVITDFKKGAIDILISTTVIEVGVNVPNATVMVICSAERFGLSSLHQLRGRVGRSSLQSVCVLESECLTAKAKERLDAMCRTTNGFEIAEADLRIRGAGDMLGTRQSGDNRLLELVLAYPEKYSQAQKVAAELLDLNPACPMVDRVLQECG